MGKRKRQTVADLAEEIKLLWRARKTASVNLATEACHRGELAKRVDAHADQLLALEERLQRVEVLDGLIPDQPEPPKCPKCGKPMRKCQAVGCPDWLCECGELLDPTVAPAPTLRERIASEIRAAVATWDKPDWLPLADRILGMVGEERTCRKAHD